MLPVHKFSMAGKNMKYIKRAVFSRLVCEFTVIWLLQRPLAKSKDWWGMGRNNKVYSAHTASHSLTLFHTEQTQHITEQPGTETLAGLGCRDTFLCRWRLTSFNRCRYRKLSSVITLMRVCSSISSESLLDFLKGLRVARTRRSPAWGFLLSSIN